MLKSVMFYLLTITTAIRFIDMAYLLSRPRINLPLSALIIAGIMILYGAFLIVKRYTGNVRLSQIMAFFAIQAAFIIINITTVAIFVPLQLTMAETVLVGSFLDLIVDSCAVYACFRQIRSSYQPFVRVVGSKQPQ